MYYTEYKFIDAASMNGCVRPGDTLTYECTVMGGVATVWTGSGFHCTYSNNDITLLHSRFSNIGSVGNCNNGAIVARILYVEGNNYTSQLNVTVTLDTAGKTIRCFHDNGTHDNILILSSIPPTITG
jgi:hypothetical protein